MEKNRKIYESASFGKIDFVTLLYSKKTLFDLFVDI